MGTDLSIKNVKSAIECLKKSPEFSSGMLNVNPVELMIHPGYESEEGIGGLPVPDEFSLSSDRKYELDTAYEFIKYFEIHFRN